MKLVSKVIARLAHDPPFNKDGVFQWNTHATATYLYGLEIDVISNDKECRKPMVKQFGKESIEELIALIEGLSGSRVRRRRGMQCHGCEVVDG